MSLMLSDRDRARIVEVFSSLQGEGSRLGERQIFVRFGGCNLHCDYCDEPDTIPIPSGAVRTGAWLRKKITTLSRGRAHKTISWTGGEPLLHADFLEAALTWARQRGFQNQMETNGMLPAAMLRLAPLCDVVSMDIKLPSATGRQTWSAHEAFLKALPRGSYVKIVLTDRTRDEELDRAFELVRKDNSRLPLYLQPATEYSGVKPMPPQRCIEIEKKARRLFRRVRLSPQWHPIWGVR